MLINVQVFISLISIILIIYCSKKVKGPESQLWPCGLDVPPPRNSAAPTWEPLKNPRCATAPYQPGIETRTTVLTLSQSAGQVCEKVRLVQGVKISSEN